MKSKVVKIGVSSILFFSMILLSLSLIRPAILGFVQQLRKFRGEIFSMVESKTGLQISYDSISPAILSAFNIKGIVLSDVESKNPVLSIRRANLSYSLPHLFVGDIDGAFSKLTISGITLEYDSLKNEKVLERLMALLPSSKIESQEVIEFGTEAEANDLGMGNTDTQDEEPLTEITLPFEIDIRDVSLHYMDQLTDILVFFKDISVTETLNQGFLQASAEGQCYINLQDKILVSMPEELRYGIQSISMDFALDASVFPKLYGSTASIQLSSISSRDFVIGRTSFLAEYDQEIIKVSTIQGILPLAIMGELDTEKENLRFLAQMNNFDPLTYIRPKQQIPLLEQLRGMKISGLYEFLINTSTLNFNYKADGDAFLPEKIFPPEVLPNGLVLDYNISGTDKDLLINHLQVINENMDFSLEGSFNIPNMRASGFAFLERLVIPGRGEISAELYIDGLDRGFTCFIPQLYFGERSFTALQLTMIPDDEGQSLDFEFEASDYSHIDFGMPGLIYLSGSVLNEDKPYLQANLAINDFFLDSAVNAASFFVPQQERGSFESMSTSLSSLVTTNELYFATDFSSISYNVDYWILADTSNDDNLLIFSFTGNESTVNLSQFDLLYAGQTFQMTAMVEFDESYTTSFFNADASLNTVPYSLSGSYTFDSWLNITGSYGLNITATFDSQDNLVEGQFSMDELPISLGNSMLLCSLAANGFVPRINLSDFRVNILDFQLYEIANFFPTNPHLAIAGHITNYGFMLENFLFQDTVSTLTGTGGMMWSFNQGNFETAGLSLSLESSISYESYSIGINFSNPEQKKQNQLDLFNDIYFSAQIEVNNLPMARLRPLQNNSNLASGVINAMGTIENPYISLELKPSSVSFGGVPFNVSANARLENGEIFVDDANIVFGEQSISDVSAQFFLADFSGSFHAKYDANMADVYTVNIPLDVTITSSLVNDTVDEENSRNFVGIINTLTRGLPEYISIDANAQLGGSLFKKQESVSVNIVRIPGFYTINSQDNLGISGSVTEDGFINMNLAGRMPIHTTVQGRISEELMDIQLRDIRADLSKFKGFVAFPFVMLHGGQLYGNLHIGGILADPEFSGQIEARNLSINSPDYVPELIISDKTLINFQDNEIIIDDAHFKINKGSANLDLNLLLDRWMLDTLTLSINTPVGVMLPALVNIPAQNPGAPSILIEGYSSCELDIEVTMSTVDVRGRFFVDDVDIDIVTSGLRGQSTRKDGIMYPSGSGNFTTTLDLGIVTGQHVEIFFDPLLRGLIAPNTRGTLKYDSGTGSYSIDSDIVLRGGEITYLNRNFYLREGQVVFTENESLDPIVTLRAEIREHDEDGEPVRITMSAENQRLSAFNPTYTSSPPKSERELMSILGQALTGDAESGWDVLLSGVDYGFQVLVLRKIENALRDFLKFDILSLRTMGLQNSLKQWLNVGGEKNKLTVGNFFDNTTVYIGKYFGSSIYADAMLHFAYDEKMALEDGNQTGLMFQPEIGLEMDSPFGAIRWSIAPDLGKTQHLWVPSTSVGISWKFTF